jgi:hypothetical protein
MLVVVHFLVFVCIGQGDLLLFLILPVLNWLQRRIF